MAHFQMDGIFLHEGLADELACHGEQELTAKAVYPHEPPTGVHFVTFFPAENILFVNGIKLNSMQG